MCFSKNLGRWVLPGALLAVLTAGGFPAQASAEPAATNAAAETTEGTKRKANRRVCRRVSVVGSHLKQRVCMKQKEWDDLTRVAQERARNSGNMAGGGPGA